MPSTSEYATVGTLLGAEEGAILLKPLETSYELRLLADAAPGAPGQRIRGLIRIAARKVMTVPSGGLFVTPIFGPPRIVQGRIRHLDERQMVLHAGTSFLVDLPESQSAYDLINGPLTVGAMVNVTALPGARFEPAGA